MTISPIRAVTMLIGLLWASTFIASAFAFSLKAPVPSSVESKLVTSISYPVPHHWQTSASVKYSFRMNGLLMSSLSNEVNKSYGVIKGALQKMRGISVSVEYSPKDLSNSSPMDIELLSQELRKAKVSSIWTCDSDVIQYFSKEQNSAKGNFPGPVPIVYQHIGGGEVVGEVFTENIMSAIQNGASAIVVESDLLELYNKNMESLDCDEVCVICKVENMQHVQMALDAGYDSAFLISGSQPDEELQMMLSSIPKSSVVIASLSSMQPDSQEISRAKVLAGLASNSAKVSSVLIHDACVGDQEDIKYCSFVVETINKKSSSTFQMTGLTGAANGHFGSEVSGGFRAAKWQRNKPATTS
jgi:hypothetical protein